LEDGCSPDLLVVCALVAYRLHHVKEPPQYNFYACTLALKLYTSF